MNIFRDILKLVLLLLIIAAVIFGIRFLTKGTDNQQKYHHPVRRGEHWWKSPSE